MCDGIVTWGLDGLDRSEPKVLNLERFALKPAILCCHAIKFEPTKTMSSNLEDLPKSFLAYVVSHLEFSKCEILRFRLSVISAQKFY